MKISEKEYTVLSEIAFGLCRNSCNTCKYYYPNSKYECFAVDALCFIQYQIKEERNEQKRISSNTSTNQPDLKS